MTEERKNYMLKYVEVTKVFYGRANATEIACRQSQRTCEVLAKHLSKSRPKTPNEFEQHEYLKDFVLKTAKTNEEIIQLLEYSQKFLQDVEDDAMVLIEGSRVRDQIRDQSDTITSLLIARDNLHKQMFDEKRTAIKGLTQ